MYSFNSSPLFILVCRYLQITLFSGFDEAVVSAKFALEPRSNSWQQSLSCLQIPPTGLQSGCPAVTDMIDVVNATMAARNEKCIVWLRWY
ncbi:hypothetical protein BDR04DRAFT_1099794, partial [Suillus decipiens]